MSARYAQALFDLAVEQGALETVERDLKSLEAMLKDSLDLRRLIVSPRFTAEDKGRALGALAQRAALSPLTGKFLGLLAANRRTAILEAVIGGFHSLAAKRRGLVSAEVVTAVPMSERQAEALRTALRSALGKDPQINARVDPAILGGVKVRVGSRLYDSSLKARLDSLKFALKRA